MVKVEPLDIPLSPGGGIYVDEHRDEEDSSSNTQNFESIIGLHEDDDPGGDIELADELGKLKSIDFVIFSTGELNFIRLYSRPQ